MTMWEVLESLSHLFSPHCTLQQQVMLTLQRVRRKQHKAAMSPGCRAHRAAERGCLAPSREYYMKDQLTAAASWLHLLKTETIATDTGGKKKSQVSTEIGSPWLPVPVLPSSSQYSFVIPCWCLVQSVLQKLCGRLLITTTLYTAKTQVFPIRSQRRWHQQIAATWQIRKQS